MNRATLLFVVWVVLAGCAGDRPSADSAFVEPDVVVDVGTDVPPAYCPGGHAPPVGKLCVVGETFADAGVGDGDIDEDAGSVKPASKLVAGEPILFIVYPKGCFSSRCSKIEEASCAVVSSAAAAMTLEGAFCLKPDRSHPCGSDCDGGGSARCSSDALAAGSYTVTIDTLSVAFTVPSDIPNEGLCEGEQY